MMKKPLMAILLVIATTLPAMAASDNPKGKGKLAEEQITQQQDLKRKEVLDGMQLQAQQRKQQQQQHDAEIQRQQDLINQENSKSSGKK